MSTGFGPTSSAVGMFEPVTMTRSAVAAAPDAGTTFPCASRATGAGAPGEGEGIAATCAGTSGIMAKKIASRTALLRNNPHSGSWTFFIFCSPTSDEYSKRLQAFNAFFTLFFYLRGRLYNFHNNPTVEASTTDTASRCRASRIDQLLLFSGASESGELARSCRTSL